MIVNVAKVLKIDKGFNSKFFDKIWKFAHNQYSWQKFWNKKP